MVLNEGHVQQVGPAQELYEKPHSPFVAQFLGQVNILPVETILSAQDSTNRDPLAASGLSSRSPAQIYVRPHDLDVHRERNRALAGRRRSGGSRRWAVWFGSSSRSMTATSFTWNCRATRFETWS